MKGAGMLVLSLRGVYYRFWLLSPTVSAIFLAIKVSFRVACKEIKRMAPYCVSGVDQSGVNLMKLLQECNLQVWLLFQRLKTVASFIKLAQRKEIFAGK